MIREALSKPLVAMARWSLRARPSSPSNIPGFADWLIGHAHALPEESVLYPDAYRLLPDVYACISLIQERIAALPMVFKQGERVLEPAEGNIAGLFANANALDTGNMLIQQIAGSYDIAGNAFLFKDYMGTRQCRELWCLSPARMRPVPGPRRTIAGYVYDNGDGRDQPIPADQVIHFRRYDPDHGLLGMSPISAAMMRVLTQRDLQRFLRNTFKQGGTVAGFFSTEKSLGDADIKRLSEEMKKRFGGPEAAGRAVILPAGLKFERQALTIAEMAFLDVSKYTSADIYRIFHIPPVIMGMKEGGGLSDAGATTDMLLFYENCIMPRCAAIASTINEMMLADGEFGPNVTMHFDFSGVLPLQEVFLQQAKQLVEIAGGPIMTISEARERLGLDDLGDPELEQIILPDKSADTTPVDATGADAARPVAKAKEATDGPARLTGPAPTSTAQARDRWRVRYGHRQALFERRVRSGFRRMFRGWRDRMLTAFSATRDVPLVRMNPVQVEDLLHATEGDRELVRRLLQSIVEHAGTLAVSDLAADVAFDMQSHAAARFVAVRTHVVLDSTLRTTWRLLRESLSQGIAAQESTQQLEERIRQVFGGRIRSSVDTIGRTEALSAHNFGNYEAWKQLGEDVVPGRVWVTARDERVRDGSGHGHDEAEGQERGINEPFLVRAGADAPYEELAHPGDPNASPGNTINCRCVAAPLASFEAGGERAIQPRRLSPSMSIEDLLATSAGHTNGKVAV